MSYQIAKRSPDNHIHAYESESIHTTDAHLPVKLNEKIFAHKIIKKDADNVLNE